MNDIDELREVEQAGVASKDVSKTDLSAGNFALRSRRRFLTVELSEQEVERIASARMDPRHDHLDALLRP